MRKLGRMLLSAFSLAAASSMAAAQQVPLPPVIKVIVPFAPGASTDVIAREVAAQLGPRLGTTVIVENRAGASGMIGASAVAKGPKDGSQLLFTSVSMISAAATMKTVPLDVVNDLVPISVMGEGPLVIAVSSKTNIRTPADLLAAARAQPDKITHGTGGVGTFPHLAAELLNDAAKIQLKHIPYKGMSLSTTDLASGVIDAMLAVNTTFASMIESGRARPIAVTSLNPSPAFPGIPTMASVVPGYEATLWTAMYAPAGTPTALLQRLNREINEIGQSKTLRDRMASDGAEPLALTLEQAHAKVRNAFGAFRKVAAAKNIVVE